MSVGYGVVIVDKDGGKTVELDAQGNLPVYIAASGDNLGRVAIKDAVTGQDARVNSAGRLLVDTEINLSGDIYIEDIKVAESSIGGTAKKLLVDGSEYLYTHLAAATVPIDVSGDVTVSATDLDIRDLTVSDKITVAAITAPIGVSGDVSISSLPNISIAKIYDSVDVSGDVSINSLPNINIAKIYDSVDVSGDVTVSGAVQISDKTTISNKVEINAKGAIRISGDLRITDNNYVAEVDSAGYLVTIPIEHHKIHEGNYFICSKYSGDVDIANPMYMHIITPDTVIRAHLVGQCGTDNAGRIQFFENPTTTANGVALSTINMNRPSATTATVTTFHSPVVSADGTLLQEDYVGTNNNKTRIGATLRNASEYILKQNEQYLLKYTPDADNAKASLNIEFYEI